jgi:hypothetical protein
LAPDNMVDRERLLHAIAAQEQLRGSLPDDLLDTVLAALRAQLDRTGVERRGMATVVFADVAGFTAMSEGMDAELVADLMNDLWKSVAVPSRWQVRIDQCLEPESVSLSLTGNGMSARSATFPRIRIPASRPGRSAPDGRARPATRSCVVGHRESVPSLRGLRFAGASSSTG